MKYEPAVIMGHIAPDFALKVVSELIAEEFAAKMPWLFGRKRQPDPSAAAQEEPTVREALLSEEPSSIFLRWANSREAEGDAPSRSGRASRNQPDARAQRRRFDPHSQSR